MLRTHTCGELRLDACGQRVVLAGWLQRSRDLGGMTFIDLRDRYGLTQLVFNMETNAELCNMARTLGREYVLQVEGVVSERSNKNKNIPTGDIEILVEKIVVLNKAKTPPFTIEDNTDGGEELRMKYRYLDLRRNCVRKNIELRHRLSILIRNYMNDKQFMEIETPFLIRSTPEGARDFVVPSRVNPNEFYALPQSPQTFKQLLMVAGYDRYFQIVRCFRDEDLRADRQPEFTQVDCEMSFVEQEDILQMFEGLMKYLFKQVKGIEMGDFPRMTYADAMRYYGSDKPDTRFEMKFVELNELMQGCGFSVFDNAELVVGICAEGCAKYTRKQLDELTDFVKRPQVGASGLVYIKYNEDGSFKSSVDKFYSVEQLQKVAEKFGAKPGDLMLVMAGKREKTQTALCSLRLEMGSRLGLRDPFNYKPLWVVDFPLLEWDEETQRYYAKHHPFTSLKAEDYPLLFTKPGEVRANAYDLVVNGTEIGGGSIRIYDRQMQNDMFKALGFSEEEAQKQFGFLLNAFEYGAPPHGGIAFGFDRMCSMFAGVETIRDFIAFPKNNKARDLMIESPSEISQSQLEELNIALIPKQM
ncbi:MAG: aspartate--tRNA ligase [Candidatus Onthomorpha sp.]|nr:aspartate--tRNA ligase [Bacteroidales bacterium]MDD5977108.1 aspartate--tRNA ligase [Bacteroidales bacterium]MDD7590562.1 aspartate--tRNA ligase [Bacteroidales bacterium]MDY5800145.1 aspartate--tRNA ligase [Candidatus Onthomorpha sp.]MDY5826332.1 aspartate--tRNA ligase [Candidatus Onthomorpha sp.]